MKTRKRMKMKKPVHPYKSNPESPQFQRRGLSIFRPPPPKKPPNHHSEDLHSQMKTVIQNPDLLSQALRIEDQQIQINNRRSDRISSLPESIIHQILSHINTRQVVHMSILSKRWRYTWLSTPYLDFDLKTWLHNCRRTSETGRIEAFMDFIDNVMIRTESLDDVSKFRFDSHDHFFSYDLPRLSSWLLMCLDRNVKSICLHFLKLPNDIFTYMNSVSNIKNLSLHGVRLPDGNAYGELLLSSSGLQDLSMCDCDVRHLTSLTISTPLLEKLFLWLYNYRQSEVAYEMKVKICNMSKLESIHLGSCSTGTLSPVYYSVEDDPSSLVSAQVHIVEEKYLDSNDEMKDECSESVIEILSRVYNARALQLSISTEKVLIDFPVLHEGLRYKFQNLRHIMLWDQMETPCICALSIFLMSFPCIESLVWERNQSGQYDESDSAAESVANGPEESISSLSSKCVYGHLKIVKTLKLEGTDSELKFLAFLLERAIVLEEIIIEYSQSLSAEKLAYFKEKVLSLPQASSNASVSFRESVVTLADYKVGRHSYLI